MEDLEAPAEEPAEDLGLSELLVLLSFSLDFPLESDKLEELPLEVELDDEDVEPLVWHTITASISQCSYQKHMKCFFE